ncbi:MAG TPA: restriction endonuclease subunit S, partial [Pseudomonadota bacterium]|nr:restriction endonuclease subunit S [Pseudomonadota bacterium]
MSFPRYPHYKPSGVEWLGEVPEHWDVNTLRRCAINVRTGGTPASQPPSCDLEQGYVWYTPGDFGDSLRLTTSARLIPAAAIESGEVRIFPPRSVLIVSIGATLGKVGFSEGESSANQQINAVIPNKRIDGYFLAFSLSIKVEEMRFLSNASTIGIMNQEKTKEIWLTVPPHLEQLHIAAFLDRETAKIDALVAEQQRLIDLLKEKRQAVISHAVTKGLDPTVPTKPSGIEWLGDIPAHWTVYRLKFLVIERVAGPYGASLTKDMYSSFGYRVYGQQQVIPDDFSIGDYFISEEKYEQMRRYRVFPGDVLISVMGTVGKVAVVPEEVQPGIINPRLVRYRCASLILPRFMQAILLSRAHQEQILFESKGTTMDGINMQILGDIPIPVPPIAEQNAI